MMHNKFKRVEDIIVSRKQKGGHNNKLGYKGVSYDGRPGRKPYTSRFQFTNGDQRVNIALGSYNTPEEAYLARLKFIDSLK